MRWQRLEIVYLRKGGRIEPAYAKWYLDRRPSGARAEFAVRSYEHTASYVSKFPIWPDATLLFVPVVAREQRLDENRGLEEARAYMREICSSFAGDVEIVIARGSSAAVTLVGRVSIADMRDDILGDIDDAVSDARREKSLSGLPGRSTV